MINDVTAFISYLAPLTAAMIGGVYTVSNRNKSLAKSFFLLSLFAVAYKSFFDFVVSFHIDAIIIPSYAMGNFFIFSCAPFLYLYFKSLLKKKTKVKADNIKHFILPAMVFISGIFFTVFIPAEILIDFLNMRFEKGILDNNLAVYSIFYTLGFPMLLIQWPVYIYLLRKVIIKRRKWYKKYYGTLEQRNQKLIKRISILYLSIFSISFLLSVFKVQSNIIIFGTNFTICSFIILAVLYGNEQLNMQKYRMYKLSSHEEEIMIKKR